MRAYALAGLPFGVAPATARVVVSHDLLDVRFGLWRLSTPRANVASAEVSGPYSFVKTAGPAHLSLSDHGVTFATNGEQGVCIEFHRPVRAINPVGPPYHRNLTVTVTDPAELVDVLRAGA